MFSTKEIPIVYKDYSFAKFIPFTLSISSDGGGKFTLFDHRESNTKRIYCVSVGNLDFPKDECFYLAKTFYEYIQQRTEISSYMLLSKRIRKGDSN